MSRFLLCISGLFGVVFVKPIAVVPRRAVGLPRAQAHPAKLGAASLIFTNHVVTAAVFLDGHVAFRAFFGVCGYPVGGLRVVVAFFNPLF